MVDCLRALKIGPVPLHTQYIRTTSPRIKCGGGTHLGQAVASSALPSIVTITSSSLDLTKSGLYGIFSWFDDPSRSSNQVASESSNVLGLRPLKGLGQLATSSARVRTSCSCLDRTYSKPAESESENPAIVFRAKSNSCYICYQSASRKGRE